MSQGFVFFVPVVSTGILYYLFIFFVNVFKTHSYLKALLRRDHETRELSGTESLLVPSSKCEDLMLFVVLFDS